MFFRFAFLPDCKEVSDICSTALSYGTSNFSSPSCCIHMYALLLPSTARHGRLKRASYSVHETTLASTPVFASSAVAPTLPDLFVEDFRDPGANVTIGNHTSCSGPRLFAQVFQLFLPPPLPANCTFQESILLSSPQHPSLQLHHGSRSI